MKRTHAFAVLAAVFLALAFAGAAFAETLDEIVNKVQKSYASMKDYQAGFIQEVSTASGPRGASGTISIKLPAKMRWDYAEPTAKQLITDGKTSWMYLPDEKQVYIQPLDAASSAKVPLQLLTGKLDFKQDYDAALLEEAGGSHRVQFKPKKQGAGFDHAVLYIDKSSLRIVRFEMFDLYGAKTSVILKDPKINMGLKDSYFVYEDKPGVEVLKAPTP